MKMKRLISGIIALVLIMGMPVSAFAADWYLGRRHHRKRGQLRADRVTGQRRGRRG